MLTILGMSMNKFGLEDLPVLTNLAILFMFSKLECEELRNFDTALVDMVNNNIVHVLVAIAFYIKKKSMTPNKLEPNGKRKSG